MNIKEILSEHQKTVDRCKKSNAPMRGWNTNIKVAHLEVILTHIKALEAENKRLREVVETMALPAWEDSDVESLFENLRQYAIDALSKDSSK